MNTFDRVRSPPRWARRSTCIPAVKPVSADGFDLLLDGGAYCTTARSGAPVVLRTLILAKTETAPFQPTLSKPELSEAPILYDNLGH